MAWIGDDSQITLRQVWNFITGHGITFNFQERVQAFTHPLWFLILSVVIFITREAFYTTILISFVFTTLSIILLLKMEYDDKKKFATLISPVFLLLFSWAFSDFTISGLENPLSYLLIGILLYIFSLENWRANLKYIYTLLALLLLNRFDFVLLYLPLAILLLFEFKSIRHFMNSIYIGALILVIWHLFSIFYFGSPFPNTFYAKLNNTYTTIQNIEYGFHYFIALKSDLSTPLIIISSLILSILSKNRILIALSIGQILYLYYILSSGGGFMQGRFFSILAFQSVGQLILVFSSSKFKKNFQLTVLTSLFFTCIILGFVSQHQIFSGTTRSIPEFPFLSETDDRPKPLYLYIGDERGFNIRTNGLFSPERQNWFNIVEQSEKLPTKYRSTCGLLGSLSLTDVSHYLIDVCALSEPFLARIPPIKNEIIVAGHHVRKIPTNYGEYLIGNADVLPDKNLNDLLSDVTLAAKGELLTLNRMKAIWRLNSGYHSNLDFSPYEDIEHWVPKSTTFETLELQNWDQDITPDKLPPRFHEHVKLFHGNLIVKSEKSKTAQALWLFIDHSYEYDIFVNEELEFQKIRQEWHDCNGLVLELSESRSINSIKLVATKLYDSVYSAANRIRYLHLLQKDEIETASTLDCSFDPFVKRR